MKAKFEDLLGKTLVSITKTENEIIFTTNEGEVFKSYHDQDCCEEVYIESIEGDLKDILNSPLILVKETIIEDDLVCDIFDCNPSKYIFYKLATIKGYVTIRWIGSSNGYYCESVDFFKIR